MAYELFLFDLDDTLLDFRASEVRCFANTMAEHGQSGAPEHYEYYRDENEKLWGLFERGLVTKEHLRVERFRLLADKFGLNIDPIKANETYVGLLPQSVVLIEHAVELCQYLSGKGEIGIITNGIHAVQTQRIANSAIAPYISFVCSSESSGFAKPDARIFEHGSTMAKKFSKRSSLMIGDRLEADIAGALNFGVDSCWFNPHRKPRSAVLAPTYEIHHLSGLQALLQ